LQKEANGRYGFSADKTLSIAQSLYEKKVLSYPRTGSRYLSDDVFDEIPDRIALLERYPAFAAHAAALKGASLLHRRKEAALGVQGTGLGLFLHTLRRLQGESLVGAGRRRASCRRTRGLPCIR